MSIRDVLARSKASVHKVHLPVADGDVFIKSLSGEGRAFLTELANSAKSGQAPLHMIAAVALCEENGSPYFDLVSEKGIALADMESKSWSDTDIQAVVSKLWEVSGLKKDAVADAEKK